MKLGNIIWKNLKVLLRSKFSSLAIVLGPLLIILLVGLSFGKSSEYLLTIGTYSDSYSELAESFISDLQDEGYKIVRQADRESCIEEIRSGMINTCIVFPSDLKVENGRPSTLEFHIDQSKVNLAYMIINTLTDSVVSRTSEISMDLTNDIVSVMFETRSSIENSKMKISEAELLNTRMAGDVAFSRDRIAETDHDVPTDADTGLLTEPLDNILVTLNFSRQEALIAVRQGLELIEYLDDEYPSVNISDLDGYKEEFMEVNRSVISTFNATLKDIDRLDPAIKKLDSNLNEMKAKLIAAGITDRDVNEKLSFINISIQESRASLSDAQNTLASAIDSINSIAITNPESIVSPIRTDIQTVSQDKTALNYMFPALIVMLVMFIGMMIPSLLLVSEKNSDASFRVFLTPTKDFVFMSANYLTSMIILSIQLAIILGLSHYAFGVVMPGMTDILLSLLAIGSLFVVIGMLIGHALNTEETVTLASFSLGSLLLFTSGVIFPIETMPAYILDKARFNPFLISTEVFKKIMLFSKDTSSLAQSIKLLLVYSAAALLLVLLLQKISKRRIIHMKNPAVEAMELKELYVLEGKTCKDKAELAKIISAWTDEEFARRKGEAARFALLVLQDRMLSWNIFRSRTKEDAVRHL